jgi:hypothetical protein
VEPIYQLYQRENGRKLPPALPSLLLFLYYLAGHGYLREVGNTFGLSKSMVWKICVKWRDIILHTLSNVIVRPKTTAQWKRLAQSNEKSFGQDYYNIVGLIDGTHIPIPAPLEQHEAYFNRKKRYSIVCQGLVDCKGLFIDVNVGQPGCCHDAYVLRSSTLWNEIGLIPAGYYILGDTAYPNREYLLTPFKEGQYEGLPEVKVRRYNRALSNIRVIVEQSFGQLKGRWRRLQFINGRKLESVKKLICCAIILYNFLQRIDDSIPRDEWIMEEEEEEEEEIRNVLTESEAVLKEKGLAERVRILQTFPS